MLAQEQAYVTFEIINDLIFEKMVLCIRFRKIV